MNQVAAEAKAERTKIKYNEMLQFCQDNPFNDIGSQCLKIINLSHLVPGGKARWFRLYNKQAGSGFPYLGGDINP